MKTEKVRVLVEKMLGLKELDDCDDEGTLHGIVDENFLFGTTASSN